MMSCKHRIRALFCRASPRDVRDTREREQPRGGNATPLSPTSAMTQVARGAEPVAPVRALYPTRPSRNASLYHVRTVEEVIEDYKSASPEELAHDPHLIGALDLRPEAFEELLAIHETFPEPLLGLKRSCDEHKKTLVLDLDETLVHSSFVPSERCSYVVQISLEGFSYDVHVSERPGLYQFLEFCAELFEVVVYTASLDKYAGPLLDRIDPERKWTPWRLYREACLQWQGNFIKHLGKLGRDMKDVLIVDNSLISAILHPEYCIQIESWYDDPADTELWKLMPILKALSKVDNVPKHIIKSVRRHNLDAGDEDGDDYSIQDDGYSDHFSSSCSLNSS